MRKALISPNELVYSYDGTLIGIRVAQVEDKTFDVAQPLYWIDCEDEVDATYWYFQTETATCVLKPIQPEELQDASQVIY